MCLLGEPGGAPGREFFGGLVGSPKMTSWKFIGNLAPDERSTKVGTHIKIM